MKKNVKTIDLFAGIGGVRLAFEKAGFCTVFANDFEPKCANTYDLNFTAPKLTVEDIKKIKPKDLPNFDFLLGGFPCQPFSVAGKRKGMDDERGTLFFEIANILKERKPVGFFLENVKNLTGHNFGETFQIILNKLDVLGYDVKYAVLNSMEYGGIPQNRERVYIVGFLKETNLIKKFTFPDALQLKKSIKDILENEVANLYYYNDKPLFEKLKNFHFKINTIYQWRRKYVRENKSGVCPTLTANMGTGGHNVPIVIDKKGIRKLTPRECARIQGFPDNFKLPKIADSYLYKQIGNSVSVPVVYRIAKNMMSVFT
ncbi:MAG: DNA cytosine methyltransferase [Patescibacteria group bacterium]